MSYLIIFNIKCDSNGRMHKQQKRTEKYRKQITKIADINPPLSVITLYVNRLNHSIEREKWAEQLYFERSAIVINCTWDLF